MNNFESLIQSDIPVVVDFFAEWCGPCKLMTPVLHNVKEKIGTRATVLKMDIDKNPSYSQRYQIQAVPTLIIFHRGNIIWRKSGVVPAQEILQRIALCIS